MASAKIVLVPDSLRCSSRAGIVSAPQKEEKQTNDQYGVARCRSSTIGRIEAAECAVGITTSANGPSEIAPDSKFILAPVTVDRSGSVVWADAGQAGSGCLG